MGKTALTCSIVGAVLMERITEWLFISEHLSDYQEIMLAIMFQVSLYLFLDEQSYKSYYIRHMGFDHEWVKERKDYVYERIN